MTPKGVADVLSKADAFLARIARMREENSRPVALYVDASEADQVVRALALHCSEQEERIAEQKRISEGFGRTIQILASNSGRIEEQLQEAEARCLELEAALRQAEQIAMSDDEVPERVMGLVWETLDARATLTPTVETERWHEGTMVEEGVTEPASSASGGQARVVGTPSDRGPGVETREDIYLVYDRQGRYVGCIPSQTWPILLRTGLSQRPSGDMDAGVAYMDDPTEEEE